MRVKVTNNHRSQIVWKCFQTFGLGNAAFAKTSAGRSRTENVIDLSDHRIIQYSVFFTGKNAFLQMSRGQNRNQFQSQFNLDLHPNDVTFRTS